jgi:hypothetical protein
MPVIPKVGILIEKRANDFDVEQKKLTDVLNVIKERSQSQAESAIHCADSRNFCVRFEVFTAVTTKNGVFWDVMPCGSCKDRLFGGT